MESPKAILKRRGKAAWTVVAWCVLGVLPRVVVAEDQIIAAKKSKVYHTHPDRCGAAKNITEANRIHFASSEEAEAEGRRLCKMCAKIDEREVQRGKEPETKPEETSARGGPRAKTGGDRAADESGDSTPSLHAARVKKVLAGGTLLMEDGNRLRLVGVICPDAGQPMADEAARFIQKKTRDRTVQASWTIGPEGEVARDRLGRIVATITTGQDSADLGGELLAEGLCWLDRDAPPALQEAYSKRQDDAAWAQRGIWKRLEGAAGRAEVFVGKYTHEYHPPGCPHLAHLTDVSSIMLNEAKGRRLAPCEHVKAQGKPQ